MRFVVKDLMISTVERGGVGDELAMPGCGPGSHCPSCSVVTCLPSCSNNSCVTTLGGGFDMTPVINPDPTMLVALKEQLTAALQQVEARQEALKTQLRPQTVEEVDALEKQLTEALEELRTIRADIQR